MGRGGGKNAANIDRLGSWPRSRHNKRKSRDRTSEVNLCGMERPFGVVHEPSGLEPARVSCYIQLLVVLNDKVNGSVS